MLGSTVGVRSPLSLTSAPLHPENAVLLFAGFQIVLCIKMDTNNSLCSFGEARPWVSLLRHLQTQYLVVKVEEVGVLFTDIRLGVRYQLPNVPAGRGKAEIGCSCNHKPGLEQLLLGRRKKGMNPSPSWQPTALAVQVTSEPPKLCQLRAARTWLQTSSFQGNPFNVTMEPDFQQQSLLPEDDVPVCIALCGPR